METVREQKRRLETIPCRSDLLDTGVLTGSIEAFDPIIGKRGLVKVTVITIDPRTGKMARKPNSEVGS